jgi:hypothetical protein
VVLAEVSYSPKNFLRLETHKIKNDAMWWVNHVIKTDPAIQPFRNHCFIRITDIPTGSCLIEALYQQLR